MLMTVAALAGLARAQTGTSEVLFSTDGFWREFLTLQTPVIGTSATDVQALANPCKTPLVANGWQALDFDDSDWRRHSGPAFPAGSHGGCTYFNSSSPSLALICARGRFIVDDAAAVGNMTLTVKYHGGVAIYLNGKEIARDNLSAKADPLALATPYPTNAFVDASGNAERIKTSEVPPEIQQRDRTSTFQIPSSALVDGLNVIAIEVHRAPYDPAFVKGMAKERHKAYVIWPTCALLQAELKADKPVSVISNVAVPAGISVWNSNPLETDFNNDHAAAGETLHPILIVAPRGGTCSGKVVFGSAGAIDKPQATISPLTSISGQTAIPAANIRIRWPRADRAAKAFGPWGQRSGAFDAIEDVPPASIQPGKEGPVAQPVWVTVSVPPGTLPGKYTGMLTISASGWSKQVPVELDVCDWTLPPPQQWKTFVELIQSPETIAMQYGLEFWSDEHFEHMIPSLELCGQAGAKTLYIPLITQTNLGNTESMVRWKKETSGYGFDLGLMKRYLDLAIKHQGKPDVVVFYVWDVYLEGGFLRYAKEGRYARPEIHNALEELQTKGPRVTTLNAAGKADELQLPQFSDPGDSETAWKKLFAEIRAEMKARGLEKAMALGIPNDAIPTKEVSEFFERVAPGTPWARHAHGTEKTLDYSLVEAVWSPRFLVYPEVKSLKGWQRSDLFVQFPRNVTDGYPLTTFRLMAEMNVMGSQRGVGRMGADFWPVLKDGRGRKVGTLSNRWPFVDWRNLTIKTTLLAPGPDGAVATARLEMLREGVQESEARIFIEQAMESDKLPPALAKRAAALLEDRTGAILQGLDNHYTCGFEKSNVHGWWNGPGQIGYHWYVSSAWQDRSRTLYSLAGDVARAINAAAGETH
jgi:hypothetical protein